MGGGGGLQFSSKSGFLNPMKLKSGIPVVELGGATKVVVELGDVTTGGVGAGADNLSAIA